MLERRHDTNERDPFYSLAGQLMGLPLKSLQGFGVPAESYGFANKQLAWETIAPLLDRASPLRTAHLRDPVGAPLQQKRGIGPLCGVVEPDGSVDRRCNTTPSLRAGHSLR